MELADRSASDQNEGSPEVSNARFLEYDFHHIANRPRLARGRCCQDHPENMGIVEPLAQPSLGIQSQYCKIYLASDRHFYRSVRYPIEIWGLNWEEFFSYVYWRTFNLKPSKDIEYVTWYRNQTCLFRKLLTRILVFTNYNVV